VVVSGSDPRPIGIFDSGLGGLTVVRAILDELPSEPILYYGDTGRFPYGPKPLEEIRRYAVQIARHLVERDVKLVVVACNSATSAALENVVAAVDVPVVAVIEPAVRAAAHATRVGRVGLIGTTATVSSGAYQRAFARLAPEVQVLVAACPSFVEYVERGDTTSPSLLEEARTYLAPLCQAGIDTLILGCTHYPLLRGAIRHVVGGDVLLISSAEETADDVYRELAARGLLAPPGTVPEHRFETSGDPSIFSLLGRHFLGPELDEGVWTPLDPVEA
jgi:glutamate racemase